MEEALGRGNCFCGDSAEATVDLPKPVCLEMWSPGKCLEMHDARPLFRSTESELWSGAQQSGFEQALQEVLSEAHFCLGISGLSCTLSYPRPVRRTHKQFPAFSSTIPFLFLENYRE